MTDKKDHNPVEDDYIYARHNVYTSIEDSKEVLKALKELALEAEHHNVFDVYFKAFKTFNDANKEILDIQMKKQVIEQGGNPYQNNHLKNPFTTLALEDNSNKMTTSDLLDVVDTEFEEAVQDNDNT